MDPEKADKWLERAIVGLVIGAVSFGALATGAVRLQDFAVVQALVVLAVVLWLVRLWINRGHRLQWVPASWAVLAFVIYAIVRYMVADVEYVARNELMRILVYAAAFFVVLNNLHRQRATRVALVALLILGALISAYAVYQFITHSEWVWHFQKPRQYIGRGSGTFICPNHLAGFLEMLLPIALAIVLVSREGALVRVGYAYLAIVILAGIGVSVSRGGWLACGISLALMSGFLVRYREYRKRALAALLVVCVAVGVFVWKSPHPQRRFGLMWVAGQLEHAGSRPFLWKPAWRMWKDHPWFGVGPGHFDVRFPAYRTKEMQSRPLWVHNDYLNALVDWGVVGAGIIAAFLVGVGLGVARTWRYVGRGGNDLGSKGSDRAARVLGISTGMIALLAHSVVDFNMQIPSNALLAIVLLANLSSHMRFATDRYWVAIAGWRRMVVMVAGLALIIYLGRSVGNRYSEGVLLTRAAAAETSVDALRLLRQAYQKERNNPETVAQIGEIIRLQSWEGAPQWRELAEIAMEWFKLGMKLNPFDAYCYVRYGMCLDWLGRHDEATEYFDRALKVDPVSYYTTLMRGWHELQRGDYASAKKWLEKSIEINDWNNELAYLYLEKVNQKLGAANPNPNPKP